MTSIRFAVKLAIYSTPRVGSSARSAASPPMDTTVPKVPPQAAAANEAANTVFHQYDFSITIYSKKPSDFQLFWSITDLTRGPPRLLCTNAKIGSVLGT